MHLADSDGVVGTGEAPATWQVTGESLAGMAAAAEGPLAASVCGRNPDDREDAARASAGAVVVGNTAARAAVDVALHDLAARRAGVTLHRALGIARGAVRTDVTLAAGNAATMAEEATKRVQDGFGVLKIKCADGRDDDLERIRQVRAAVGQDVALRLDANQGWGPREAVRGVRAMEDAGLDLGRVEQPVAARDLNGLAYVTAHVDTPVLADESVCTSGDLLAVVRRRAADAVNISLAKCGGLTLARELLAVARAAGVGVLVRSMMKGPIGVAAACVLAGLADATAPSDRCASAEGHDLDAAWWLATDPTAPIGTTYAAGELTTPASVGLGIVDGAADDPAP